MSRKLIIAIDGYSSCGKSTLAVALAKALEYIYIDTGAMYRAVTVYFLEHGVDPDDMEDVQAALDQIHIDFRHDPITGDQLTFLNGVNVEDKIRTMEISQNVSKVSQVHEVRVAMIAKQRLVGQQGNGIVMDGRDIGTVVFPDADIKFFITADMSVRAQRRYDELMAKGLEVSFEEVLENLQYRDEQDTNRAESPLRKAVDAILIDTTHLTPEEQFQKAFDMAKAEIIG